MIRINQQFEESFMLSAEIYKGFIDVFKDHNPLHTNDAFALEKGFSQKVMHGNILNGFLSFFIGECLPIKNVIIHSQQISFKKPVYLDDNLIFKAIVDDVFESVNAVIFKFEFINQQHAVVASGKIQIGIL